MLVLYVDNGSIVFVFEILFCEVFVGCNLNTFTSYFLIENMIQIQIIRNFAFIY